MRTMNDRGKLGESENVYFLKLKSISREIKRVVVLGKYEIPGKSGSIP